MGRQAERKIRVYGDEHYLSLDSGTGKLFIVERPTAEAIQSSDNPLELLSGEVRDFGQRDILMDEIVTFVDSVESSTSPLIDGKQGRDALHVCIDVVKSIKANQAMRKK